HPPAEVVRQAVPPSYQSPTPIASHGSAFGQQQLSHLSVPGATPRKSKAIWWVLGGILVIGVIGVGAVVMIIAIASMGGNSNANSNRGNNNRVVNRNVNANTNVANANTTPSLPATMTEDFSEQKWGTGNYAFGDIWYSGDEYHMRAKPEKYL